MWAAFKNGAEQGVRDPGLEPAAKAPPKRRHFAAVTEIPETRPSRFSDSAQLKKRRIPKEVRLNLLWARVGGEPTVLTLTLNLKLKKTGQVNYPDRFFIALAKAFHASEN
ncbi:hypothetical protein EAH77_24245 [Ewingella americana]|uniref:Uncharacterized protein n=1 Tax=Ewingella americana TaxID=41202 RepID=A0A502FW68_9GAMM|nr:hypothetical protein EAH77_24245 [Ewingella americana]